MLSAEEEEGFPAGRARDPAVPLHHVARPRRALARAPRPQVRSDNNLIFYGKYQIIKID